MKYRFRFSIGVVCLAALAVLPAAAAPPSSDGGVFWTPGPLDEMSDAQRAEIQARIASNIQRLIAEGRLSAIAAAPVLLAWPLQPHLGPEEFNYYVTWNFVDEDPNFPNQVLDYNCGTRSYDTAAGYNHQGTDISLWPFPWNRMDANAVDIVAAADGVIIDKQDGNFDRNCAANAGNWNAVYVRHADGSVAWYGHMKNGSLTAKNIGDAVVTGERLGGVGSSGSSSGPHLHIELYDSAAKLVDPWQGPCNLRNPASWWAVQPPYYESAVSKLMTGFAKLVPGTCPDPDVSNEAVIFHPGDTVYFNRFYRDQLSTLPSVNTIYRPDSSTFNTWTDSSPQYYPASGWWNSRLLNAAQPTGKWRFEVVFNGKTYNHDFWLVGPGQWLLRNARLGSVAPLSMPLASIFVGVGATTLDLDGPDAVAGPGEGDDDDAYVPAFVAGQQDPDASIVGDATRPLVFYQVDGIGTPVRLVKSAAGGIAVSY